MALEQERRGGVPGCARYSVLRQLRLRIKVVPRRFFVALVVCKGDVFFV